MRTILEQVGTISFLGYTVTSRILLLLASVSGGFKGGKGVQMHLPLAASNVFLRT